MPAKHLRFVPLALLAAGLSGCAALDLFGPGEEPLAAQQPRCDNPAPLTGQYDARAPGYIVAYHTGIDAVAVTERLAQQFGFKPLVVWPSGFIGFAAELSDAAVAGIRCAPEVKRVGHNGVVSGDV